MRWSLLTCSYDYRELITWVCVMLLSMFNDKLNVQLQIAHECVILTKLT